MSARFVLSAVGVALAGIALSGCVDDRRVYDRPGVIVVDRDRDYFRDDRRYEPEVRRGYRRYDYRDYDRAQRRAERDDFCRLYPADRRCFGREW